MFPSCWSCISASCVRYMRYLMNYDYEQSTGYVWKSDTWETHFPWTSKEAYSSLRQIHFPTLSLHDAITALPEPLFQIFCKEHSFIAKIWHVGAWLHSYVILQQGWLGTVLPGTSWSTTMQNTVNSTSWKGHDILQQCAYVWRFFLLPFLLKITVASSLFHSGSFTDLIWDRPHQMPVTVYVIYDGEQKASSGSAASACTSQCQRKLLCKTACKSLFLSLCLSSSSGE